MYVCNDKSNHFNFVSLNWLVCNIAATQVNILANELGIVILLLRFQADDVKSKLSRNGIS